MGVHSAGIVLWREVDSRVEVLLVHPGGPYWANKDTHGWSIPKGEFDPDGEASLAAARREFAEELGQAAPDVDYHDLGSFRAGNKHIHAWLGQADLDVTMVESNEFEMEWPPRSGRMQSFPEVDRAAWVVLDEAATKLHKGQAGVTVLVAEHLRDHRAF